MDGVKRKALRGWAPRGGDAALNLVTLTGATDSVLRMQDAAGAFTGQVDGFVHNIAAHRRAGSGGAPRRAPMPGRRLVIMGHVEGLFDAMEHHAPL